MTSHTMYPGRGARGRRERFRLQLRVRLARPRGYRLIWFQQLTSPPSVTPQQGSLQ